jgi:tetratricopeptide (TPR) repeat protein
MQLGPYAVLSELGTGGAGTVYRARAPSGEEVAVKLLHATRAPDALARFDRERRLLASLGEAEGFVPLLDAGATPRGPYLVMALIPGGTLRDRLARGPLAIDEAIGLGLDLARALAAAHARGIVHRDLKPENVLFTAEGRPLVADLGLAKHFSRESPGASRSVALSRGDELRGTAGYMAPEQAADAAGVGPTADVFSLGAVLYECLAGVPAFPGMSVLEVIAKVDLGETVALRRVRTDVPPWLEAVVSRALARDPARRFPGGAELALALVERRTSGRRSLRVVPVVLALVAATLAVGAASIALLRPGTRPPPAAPPLPAPPLRGPGVTARDLAARAEAAGREGKLEDAIALASRGLELDPRSGLLHRIRGVARLRTGTDAGGALADLDRAIELDPRDGSAFAHRASVRYERHDLAGSVEDYTRAIAAGVVNARVLGNRGRAYYDLGALEPAIADLDRAIELDASTAEFLANRAAAAGALRGPKAAIQDLEKAVALTPEDAVLWAELGRWKGEAGDAAGSIAACDRSIELDPGVFNAWSNRGTAHIDRGEVDQGISDLTGAIALRPGDGPSYANRGVALRQKGEVDAAVADLARALELLPPGHPMIPNIRAFIADLRARKRP